MLIRKEAKTLNKCIKEMKKKFSDILENYYAKKYELESNDAKYKDDETNIFANEKLKKLNHFIDEESKLYRQSNYRYQDILSIITSLIENITNWQASLLSRKSQGILQAKREFDSERYYLNDMLIRLDFYRYIVALLIEIEENERLLLEEGKELSADKDYEAYILNKCILLSQVGYCKKECTQLVIELNNRVNNNIIFNGDFWYKLTELNFQFQNYNEACLFVNKAIIALNAEMRQGIQDKERECQVHDMLFSSYQLQILGHEFCGNYEQALAFLTQKDSNSIYRPQKEIIENIINVFELKLANVGGIEFFSYSNDDSPVGKIKREKIIDKLDSIFLEKIFESDIFNYVYDSKNKIIFEKIVDLENQKLSNRLNNLTTKLNSSKKFDENKITDMYESNKIPKDSRSLLYECIHVMAHCINEYGVVCFRNKYDDSLEYESNEILSRKLILLGRALMLYVSNKVSIYKSCYATTYAEIGDFWIAANELEKVMFSDAYSKMDVTTKAELAFFYCLINGMSCIDMGTPYNNDKNIVDFHNRYLNYCYRSFDYDAIAHMRVYSFRNKIANILRNGDLSIIAQKFLEFSQQKVKNKNPFEKFVEDVYFQNTNKRLKFEYEKVKYMYSFLHCLFEQCNINEYEKVSRDFRILDNALKYMHFYNSILHNDNNPTITYVDFSNIDAAITSLKQIYRKINWDGKTLSSDYCVLEFVNSNREFELLIEKVDKNIDQGINKMYFLICNNTKPSLKNKNRKTSKINQHLRFFDNSEAGLKEFVIFNTFFSIKDDFTNPQNIFVITPIGTAKSCRYRVANNIELLDECFNNEQTVVSNNQQEVFTQYRAVAKKYNQEVAWEKNFNDVYDNKIEVVISIFYDQKRDTNNIKYKYKYCVNSIWREAVLFLSKKLFDSLNSLYFDLLYDKPKTHQSCAYHDNSCSVKIIKTTDDILKNLKHSFVEINFDNVNKMLLCKWEMGSVVSWRMVFLNNKCTNNELNDIKKVLCSNGHGIKLIPESSDSSIEKWPTPYDFLKNKSPFLFVCHDTRDNNTVKKELREFFEKHKIPIWYDKEKIILEDSWKEKIEDVVYQKHCVGCIVLITNDLFFESPSIQFELSLLSDKKSKDCLFKILPIVFGITDTHDDLRKIIRNSVSSIEPMNKVENLILPTDSKMITFLNKNQTISDYTSFEKNQGRNGSIFNALDELNINYEKEN